MGNCVLLSSKVYTQFCKQFISRPHLEAIPYRACIAVGDRLYVIGGQEGDFMAKPGSPIFKCSRRFEVYVAIVFI